MSADLTPEALQNLRECWTGSRDRLARMLDAMDVRMRAKHGHGLPPEVMALGNVFHPEPVVLGLLDDRDRLAARVLYLEAPGECQSLHKLRAERDELAAEVAAYQGRPEGAMPGWTPARPGMAALYERAQDGAGWFALVMSTQRKVCEWYVSGDGGGSESGHVPSARAGMRAAEAAARSRGWLS